MELNMSGIIEGKPMQNEKVIEKLKKLFALGQSSNEHEAKLAMQKANDIMLEYQISATEIDLSEDGAVMEDNLILEEGKRQTWIQNLAAGCGELYDCKVCFVTHKRLHAHKYTGLHLRFFGTEADIMATKMTFLHLYESWKSIVRLALYDAKRNAYSFEPGIDARVFKNSHGIGFTTSIQTRIRVLVEDRRAKVKTVTGRDLVLVKGAVLSDYMSGIKTRTVRQGNKVDQNAVTIGYNAGKSIPLHGAIKEEKVLQIAS